MSEETADPTITPESTDPLDSVPAEPTTPTLNSLLGEEYKDNANLGRYESVDALAKGYLEANKMISSSIRIPTEDTAPEKVEAFYEKLKDVPGVVRISDDGNLDDVFSKLGRPEEATGYQLEAPDDVDPSDLAEFQTIAHKTGLNNQQAQLLFNSLRAGVEAQKEEMFSQREKAEEALKSMWGESYNERLDGADKAVQAWDSKFPGFAEAVKQSGMGRDPGFLSAMSEIGARVAEGKIPDVKATSNQYGMSAEEARAKISEIQANPSHDYWVGEGNKKAEAAKKMERLYKIAYS